MGIRSVKWGQFMLCKGCGELFLVADAVGSADVWHAPCNSRLDLQLSVDAFTEATLAMVVLDREGNRLEVRPGYSVT